MNDGPPDEALDRMAYEPVDRLTRMANRLLRLLEEDPEYRESDRAVIFMDDSTYGGVAIHGYEEGEERYALVDVISHATHMAKAFGVQLDVMFPRRN